MKLSKYRDTYYEFSGKASDVARQLAFAGIALIWIFKMETSHGFKIPSELILPAAMFALTLAFDLLQYISGTCVWGIFQWYKEKKLDNVLNDPDLDTPSWFKWPQLTFFVSKLITIILGYFILIRHLFNTLL